jgi:hypothetical protein
MMDLNQTIYAIMAADHGSFRVRRSLLQSIKRVCARNCHAGRVLASLFIRSRTGVVPTSPVTPS